MGVQVSLPLFTGGALGAAEDRARALERAARAEHRDRMEAARVEIEEAFRAVEAARQGALASDVAHSAADEAYRLVNRRFREGMATTAELLQAEARAAEFRTRSVDARMQYHQAVAGLAFARGDRVDLPAELNP
jgi:outer membrane protein TolC